MYFLGMKNANADFSLSFAFVDQYVERRLHPYPPHLRFHNTLTHKLVPHNKLLRFTLSLR